MQHLRAVGDHAESYLVEAPVKKGKGKAARLDDGGFTMKDDEQRRVALPDDVLPSHPLDEVSYTELTSNKAEKPSLQPDMDPTLREVLEALDDEAYAVDDGTGTDGEDDFFGTIVKGGVRDEYDDEDEFWDEEDEGEEDGAVAGVTGGVRQLAVDDEDESLEARVARFKAAGGAGGASDDEDEFSEGGDTIAELKASSARRPPRRGASAAGSNFSMSSSAMFRNEGLRTLDDRFDEVSLAVWFDCFARRVLTLSRFLLLTDREDVRRGVRRQLGRTFRRRRRGTRRARRTSRGPRRDHGRVPLPLRSSRWQDATRSRPRYRHGRECWKARAYPSRVGELRSRRRGGGRGSGDGGEAVGEGEDLGGC